MSAKKAALPKGHLPVVSHADAQVDRVRFPDLADLMARLHFSTGDGRIWLDDQRMLLVHAKALGSLRRELVETLGMDTARGLLTRMGYQAGANDAHMARRVRPKEAMKDMFMVGPQMHCLEGIGLSEPIRLDFDIEKGTHYGEFIWTSPFEDEEHIRHFPIGTEPGCWMQIGYASGFSSEFMGRPVLYREVECQSMGQPSCRIIGKTVDEWGEDAAADLRFLMPAMFGHHAVPVSDPRSPAPVPLPPATPSDVDLVGISPGFNSVLHSVRLVAPTQATVLFIGESGVGKEVFARTLHRMSARADKPFVALSCAAIPDSLIESELFGVERGAFTGAVHSRPGRFERADGGTLFLDEIGTLSPGGQVKLLRVLQEGEIERLGDTHTRRVDVRVLAATNVDLRDEVRAGRFREDLFFRLNVFPIRITPLRERRDDIPLLMTHFLTKFNRLHGRRLTGFTQRAVDAILSYDWPGNVREVENVIERGVILAADSGAIDASHLFTSGEKLSDTRYALNSEGRLVSSNTAQLLVAAHPDEALQKMTKGIANLLSGEGDLASKVSLDELESLLLKKAIEREHGNVAAAARLLGITRPQMVYRLKARGIVHDGD